MKFKYNLNRLFSNEISDFQSIILVACLAAIVLGSLLFFVFLLAITHGLMLFVYIAVAIYYLFKKKVFYFERNSE